MSRLDASPSDDDEHHVGAACFFEVGSFTAAVVDAGCFFTAFLAAIVACFFPTTILAADGLLTAVFFASGLLPSSSPWAASSPPLSSPPPSSSSPRVASSPAFLAANCFLTAGFAANRFFTGSPRSLGPF